MKKTGSRLLLAAVFIVASGSAGATGFQLLQLNASGLGNAYAGSAAIAENASTIFFNPAGMTQLKAREYSVGLTAIQPSLKFSDGGSSVGALSGTGNGGNAGEMGLVPNGYLSWAYDKNLYMGIGFGVPFGLTTKYDKPWLGAAQATSFEIKTYNINPSLAFKVSDTVSIGAGLNWQRFDAEYKRQLAVFDVFGPGTATTPLKLKLDDEAWGWNVGMLINVSPATRLGISYRSRLKYDLDGSIVASGPSGLANAAISGSVKANVELPDTFILSIAHEYSDRWELLGDISTTGWGRMSKIDVVYTSGAAAQTLDTNFRDTWRAAAGANYQLADDVKLKFGLAYDQTPIKNAASRLVALPENNHIWFSFGSQWAISDGTSVDLGIAHLYMKDASIDNDQTLDGRGRVTGTYKNSAWILGAQYSANF